MLPSPLPDRAIEARTRRSRGAGTPSSPSTRRRAATRQRVRRIPQASQRAPRPRRGTAPRGSRAHERPVADAVRAPIRPNGLTHVFLVGLVVALEPADAAVAFEDEQVRGDAVEEPAVVADDDDAAGKVEERLLERAQRVHVEIVRRFVQQQHVAAGAQELREMHTVPFAAREISHFLLLIGAAEVEGRGVRPRIPSPRPDLDALLAAGDLFPHVLRGVERVAALRDVRELDRLADAQRPCVDLLLSSDEPEECGLARAVRADDADDAAAREREAQVIEQELVAVRLADALRFDDDVTEPRSRRDRDLELALAELRVFGEKALVGLDARLALRLT